MSRIKIDLHGKKFGMLRAIAPTRQRKDKKVVWEFLCDCGKKHHAIARDVANGHTKSCGCLISQGIAKRSTKHGCASHIKGRPRSYVVWVNMRDRCNRPSSKNYPRYGGRGIKVCDRWGDYASFIKDMGEPPPRMTLERIDSDGDYEPSNCMWATRKEQARNTSRNKFIEHNGEVLILSEWARRYGMRPSALSYRLKKGMSLMEAVNA